MLLYEHSHWPLAMTWVVCVFLWAVRHVRKDERKYYEELLKYSRDHLMLYPYHLSDIMVKGLRVTPFSYYIGIMEVSNFWRIAQQSSEDWGMMCGVGVLSFSYTGASESGVHCCFHLKP